jgi:hypothetical protein
MIKRFKLDPEISRKFVTIAKKFTVKVPSTLV